MSVLANKFLTSFLYFTAGLQSRVPMERVVGDVAGDIDQYKADPLVSDAAQELENLVVGQQGAPISIPSREIAFTGAQKIWGVLEGRFDPIPAGIDQPLFHDVGQQFARGINLLRSSIPPDPGSPSFHGLTSSVPPAGNLLSDSDPAVRTSSASVPEAKLPTVFPRTPVPSAAAAVSSQPAGPGQRIRVPVENVIDAFLEQSGVFAFTAAGIQILQVNQKLTDVSGWTAGELSEADFINNFHPDDRNHFLLHLQPIAERKPVLVPRVRLITKGGDYITVDLYASLVHGEVGLFWIIDQTERYRAIDELALSQAYLVNSPTATTVIEFDDEGKPKVMMLSTSLADMLGHPREEMLQGKITDVIAEESYPVFAEMVATFREAIERSGQENVVGTEQEWRVQMRCKDGTIIPVDLLGKIGSRGDTFFAICVYTDARERIENEAREQELASRRLEQERREAEKAAAIGVAHDVNNGLTLVAGRNEQVTFFFSMLISALSGSDASQITTKLNGLVRSRIARGSEKAEELQRAKEPFEQIATLMREAVHTVGQSSDAVTMTKETLMRLINWQTGIRRMVIFPLHSIIDRKGIQTQIAEVSQESIHVEFDLHAQPGTINADIEQVKDIISVLVTNAVDAMQDSSERTLAIATSTKTLDKAGVTQLLANEIVEIEENIRPQSYVRLLVTDTGHGMEPGTVKEYFKFGTSSRDLQPTSVTHNKGRGGQGLYKVRTLMEEFGGFIVVTTEPGQGSRMHLYFPTARATRDSYRNLSVGTD